MGITLPSPPEPLGIAAATLKVIGGWDESVPIVLRVNDKTVEVRIRFGEAGWEADAREVDQGGA
jgi:hypothetical protein